MTRILAGWLFALAAIGAVMASAGEAQAGYGSRVQWCVRAYDGADDCSYLTFEQCKTAVWGTGGSCVINPRYVAYPDRPYRKTRKVYR
jgi:hypothetical protein